MRNLKKLEIHTNPEVELVFAKYPGHIRNRMLELRELILEAARELEGVYTIEETLKWGEPSYLTKHGSTLRMDWKQKAPDQFAMYFKCTSRLVETFRIVFKNNFDFEGNRAIIFQVKDEIPKNQLKKCIKAALTYHKVKYLPELGISE